MIESAVDAFSRTFSNPTSCEEQRTALSAARGKATIHDLPAELLCVIFRLIYATVYEYHYRNQECPEQNEWLEQDIMSASLFPYAPASVCSFWRDVMSSLPKFWERLVIFVNPPATPLSAVASQLSWSRNGRLDVFITRRAFHDVDGRHERSQVAAIMNLILPHIHRIRNLSIDVMFSSSLPSFPTDFHGNATMMLDLELKCKEDDGGSDHTGSVPLTDRKEFRCPKLKHLVIDGRNYYEACKSDPQWTTKVATLTMLTISHFRPNPGESFSTREFLFPLPALRNLDVLHITHLILHPSPEPLDIPDLPDLELPLGEFLEFEDLHSFKVIEQIIYYLNNPYNISFTRCTFEDIMDESDHFADHGYGGVLSLKRINDDLVPLLRLWHGHSLEITDCPRCDDALLEAMSFQENGVFNCAAYVEDISMGGCPDLSVAALRRLVESRLDLPENNNDPFNQVTPRIHGITLPGYESMSPSEWAWFNANLPNNRRFYL